jgi:predicted acylesterase/phospholipase RssA
MHKQQSRTQADLYLTPPLERFRILDMGRIDEIIATGYEYAARRLDALDLEAFLAPHAPME